MLFSNVDLFKVDIVKSKNKNSDKVNKLTLILKNNYLLFISISFIQAFVDFLRGRIADSTLEKLENKKQKLFVLISFLFSTVLTTEVFPNYLAGKESSKLLALNGFFLRIGTIIIAFFAPLKIFLKERKKFFTYNESDLIRFINNLTSKEILLLEPNEAKLVKLAFDMDDKEVSGIVVPLKKTICLYSKMNTEDIKRICLEKSFTKYPVFDSISGKVLGIFNVKSLLSSLLRGEDITNWRNHLSQKVVYLENNAKLSTALETLKNSRSYLAIVRKNKEIVGIVSLKDILGSLVGKIHDEQM